ncbi:MAG: hypothetical protein KDA84_07190, partial [Planctomycetaceae bacterium]|nr:hypothetical protein [Planctomycetaceae bacterium]
MSQLTTVCLILPLLQMPNAAEMDKKLLQGDWKYYTGKITWNPMWGKNVFDIDFAFKDDQGSFQFDKFHQTGTIRLDPAKTPKRMTIALNQKGKGAKSTI